MLKLLDFDKILEQAHSHVDNIPGSKQKSLKEALSHGKALLDDNDQMKAYIHFYGDMHKGKLLRAYSKFPDSFIKRKYSIIDWGCGQGLATLIFTDYLESKEISTSYLSDITLVEPSRHCLRMAERYLEWTLPKSDLYSVCKNEEDVDPEEITPYENSILHLVSNLIDMPEVEGKGILNFISKSREKQHIVVCVCPFYPEEGRGKRMYEFGEKLKGFKTLYTFERHIEDWKEDYSCQIRIFANFDIS